MPEAIDMQTKLRVIYTLLTGLSFRDTAAQCGVAKSTVSAIWGQFARGEIPGTASLAEEAVTLREVAIELRQNGLTASAAAAALRVMRKFAALELEPDQLEGFIAFIRKLASEEAQA